MHSSHLYHEATHNMASNGINVGDVSIDVGKMMESKRGKVEALTGGIEYLCKKYKVGPPLRTFVLETENAPFEHSDKVGGSSLSKYVMYFLPFCCPVNRCYVTSGCATSVKSTWFTAQKRSEFVTSKA